MRTGAAICEVCLAAAAAILALTFAASAQESGLNKESINAAEYAAELPAGQSPLVAKLQILLDRANASPGVIDGIYGENVAKAISAVEAVNGLPVDGKIDEEVWSVLSRNDPAPAIMEYEITAEDMDYEFSDGIPDDFAEMAEMDRLNYTSPEEMLAERFHMDIDLFGALNNGQQLEAGRVIFVANVEGSGPEGRVVRIEADKGKAQLRAYDEDDQLLVAYPATIGSEENPSPSGTHDIASIAEDPVYYYRPDENFQQGENTEPLDIPPGPNNPVGTIWIDLSEPTYGIHGTPSPEEIDKTASHGCVRLTNWDAEELASLVEPGVPVEFID